MNSLEIKDKIATALKTFGSRSFIEKTREVIDTTIIIHSFNKKNVQEIKQTMEELATDYHGQILVGCLLVDMQDIPEDRFNDLLKSPILKELF